MLSFLKDIDFATYIEVRFSTVPVGLGSYSLLRPLKICFGLVVGLLISLSKRLSFLLVKLLSRVLKLPSTLFLFKG